MNNYFIPVLINIGAEIYLISKKIINKINVTYILSRKIDIINASKKAIYIEGIYNNQKIIYEEIKINISFIIININTYDVILEILYILITRINIYIKKKF